MIICVWPVDRIPPGSLQRFLDFFFCLFYFLSFWLRDLFLDFSSSSCLSRMERLSSIPFAIFWSSFICLFQRSFQIEFSSVSLFQRPRHVLSSSLYIPEIPWRNLSTSPCFRDCMTFSFHILVSDIPRSCIVSVIRSHLTHFIRFLISFLHIVLNKGFRDCFYIDIFFKSPRFLNH